MNDFYKKGITALEIIIVLGVVGVLLALILPNFSKIREDQVVKSAASDILSAISKARSQTLASVESSEYGVRFESDRVIIFKGKVYSSGAPDNEIISIYSPASISNVTLGGVSGNSGDMYFNRLYGVPSLTGTITISTSSISKTITISATGITSIN